MSLDLTPQNTIGAVCVSFELLTDGVAPDIDALGICLAALGKLTPQQRGAVLAYLNVAPWSKP